MPPPPPPSKSYLLVLDSDSSDDDDDSYRIRVPTPSTTTNRNPTPERHGLHTTTVATITTPTNTTIGSPNNRRRPHIIEDEDDDDEEDRVRTRDDTDDEDQEGHLTSPCQKDFGGKSEGQTKLTKNQKKKLARRRNKKQMKSSVSNGSQNRRIQFSTVSCRLYPRSFSDVSVPADGGWPLGMELDPIVVDGEPEDIPIEEFEAKKQEKLKERWEKLLQCTTIDTPTLENVTKRPDGTTLALETRQWDYRNKVKNPLFGALSEEQRQDLLLEASADECEDSVFQSKGRPRSQSFGDHVPKQPHDSPQSKRRNRTSSFSHTEHFSEKYNQVYVHQVRNGLEQLRNERTKPGSTGCNCRKLSVHIPPKNGCGGKKAAHRRLKPSKLREELKKRNLLDESKTREQLEQILHDAVEKEPCCSTNDCFCVRNGIDCQADGCSCWHDSHVNMKSTEKYLSVNTIKTRCGNPLGMSVVDIDGIEDYRIRVLEAAHCQFITIGTTTTTTSSAQ